MNKTIERGEEERKIILDLVTDRSFIEIKNKRGTRERIVGEINSKEKQCTFLFPPCSRESENCSSVIYTVLVSAN